MQLQEGQMLEGAISLSGEEGPWHRWIVVAPFGKTHIHSIDHPEELHCWPIHVARQGIDSGRLKLTGDAPDHPVLQLQREKEARGIDDTHIAPTEAAVESLVALLEEAVGAGAPFIPYLVGEIRTHLIRSGLSQAQTDALTRRVDAAWAQFAAEH